MRGLNRGTKLRWLGHGSWLITSPEGRRILVDPFLSGNPSCPEDVKTGGPGPLDVILVTHGHDDHIADLAQVASKSGAVVIGIYDLTSWLAAQGLDNLSGMNKGGTQFVEGIGVTMTHALHSSSRMSGGTPVYLGEACGYTLAFENGFRLYLAGDTAVFGDMALIRELYAPEVAILPIGDHFTMGPREAAKAVELLGVKRVVPDHFGTFPLLTGTPEALAALLPPDVELLTLAPGETLE